MTRATSNPAVCAPAAAADPAAAAAVDRPVTVAFVLVSWAPDAPAGMERATAAAAAGLAASGHHPLIVTAAAQPAGEPAGRAHPCPVPVYQLQTLRLRLPADDETLRAAISAHQHGLQAELRALYHRRHVDVAVYVDALWGLGRAMPTNLPRRRVLAVHVIGAGPDLADALARQPTAVIVPSAVVQQQAPSTQDSTGWKVVPNTLLTASPARPGQGGQPDPQQRQQLRIPGPLRVLARLGPEKGVAELLAAAADQPPPHRSIEVALAAAGFEQAGGGQSNLLQRCRALAAAAPATTLRAGLPWAAVPGWLAGAAAVIVPSLAETFGLVALEAASVGTPVIAYRIGNLPHLLTLPGSGEVAGALVPPEAGPGALWRAARSLLADPVTYAAASRAAYYSSQDYQPHQVTQQFLEAVWST